MEAREILAGIPEGIRAELLGAFATIVRNYREARWEPSELNGGKFCEVVYSILRGHVDGAIPRSATKPRNMVDACKNLESAPEGFPRAIRIQIPRMLTALYEIRNNRGVGHVGGDVSPNRMDARVVLETTKWILADLIRVFHGVDTVAATVAVDALSDRTVPIVWQVGSNRRVLNPKVHIDGQILLLLFATPAAVKDRELCRWVEYGNFTRFKANYLKVMHRKRLIEWDKASGMVHLSPTGIAEVETRLPLEL